MKQSNNDILVDYLDKKLSPEESSELESLIQRDKTTASDFEYLKLAVETIRLNAIAGKVVAARGTLLANPDMQTTTNQGTVRQLYKTALRIAAVLILLFSSAVVYKYTSVSNQSVYTNQFVPYDLSITRGGESRDGVAEAYNNKNWNNVVALFNIQKTKDNKSYFLAAMAEMQLHQYDQAANLFQHILGSNSGDGSFQEEAEYYCALAYLMNHEEAKSIVLINKIKSDPSHRYYPVASKITNIDLKIIDLKK